MKERGKKGFCKVTISLYVVFMAVFISALSRLLEEEYVYGKAWIGALYGACLLIIFLAWQLSKIPGKEKKGTPFMECFFFFLLVLCFFSLRFAFVFQQMQGIEDVRDILRDGGKDLLYDKIQSLMFFLLGYKIEGIIFLDFLIQVFSYSLLYGIGKRFMGKRGAILSLILFGFWQLFLFRGIETFQAFLLLLALFCFSFDSKEEEKKADEWIFALVGSCIMGYGIFVQPSFFFFFLGAGAWKIKRGCYSLVFVQWIVTLCIFFSLQTYVSGQPFFQWVRMQFYYGVLPPWKEPYELLHNGMVHVEEIWMGVGLFSTSLSELAFHLYRWILCFLNAMYGISLWKRGRGESILYMAIVVIVFFFSALHFKGQETGIFFPLLCLFGGGSLLAFEEKKGGEDSFSSKDLEKREVEEKMEKEKRQEKAKEEFLDDSGVENLSSLENQVKFIKNPLPLPKKHVSKVMDYDLTENIKEEYDYEVSEEDDYDIS